MVLSRSQTFYLFFLGVPNKVRVGPYFHGSIHSIGKPESQHFFRPDLSRPQNDPKSVLLHRSGCSRAWQFLGRMTVSIYCGASGKHVRAMNTRLNLTFI